MTMLMQAMSLLCSADFVQQKLRWRYFRALASSHYRWKLILSCVTCMELHMRPLHVLANQV
jgi:hypothetical protein